MQPTTPVFEINDSFDADVEIGEKTLPIHVKRFSRAEIDAFDQQWAALIELPRGTAEPDPVAQKKLDDDRLRFVEASIREYVTVDKGLLVNRGVDVTDGAGIIDMFYARKDALVAFLSAIQIQNRLTSVMRKKSTSPRDSGTGSAPSTQARGGDRPEPIAESVASSSTAAAEPVTEESSSPADRSGETNEGTESSGLKVH